MHSKMDGFRKMQKKFKVGLEKKMIGKNVLKGKAIPGRQRTHSTEASYSFFVPGMNKSVMVLPKNQSVKK
jgi:hypothetical protein